VKRMFKAFLIYLLIPQVICPISTLAQEGEVINPGVSRGDSFKYKFYVTCKSADVTFIPPNIRELNNTESISIVVHEAFYALVIMNTTTYFKNATRRDSQIWVNLLSGEGDGFGLIILPNLSPNRLAYHMGIESNKAFLLREENVRTYPFGQRTVLHASTETYGSDDYVRIQHDIYYDKETGVMLEWYIQQTPKYAPTVNVTMVWLIEEFNIKSQGSAQNAGQTEGSFSPSTYTFIILTAVIIITLGALLYKRKRRKLQTLHQKKSI